MALDKIVFIINIEITVTNDASYWQSRAIYNQLLTMQNKNRLNIEMGTSVIDNF